MVQVLELLVLPATIVMELNRVKIVLRANGLVAQAALLLINAMIVPQESIVQHCMLHLKVHVSPVVVVLGRLLVQMLVMIALIQTV